MHEEEYHEADRRDHSKYNRRKTKNTSNGDKESWRMKRCEISYGYFFRQAPAMNPNQEKITGVVCGVRVENIERIEILYHKYNLQSWKKVLSYVTERLKAVLREEPGKEKDMFTIISKFYLNSELKHEALHAYEQGYDAVRLDQMKHYWDLCRKRRE